MGILTPNMSLNVPTIGVDSGITWEQNINANSSILDGHNHSAGSGVQINPSGLLINADLPVNQNNVTLIRTCRFYPYGSPLSAAADLGCLYVSGVDLYYNDENGTQIQITSGGLVNATSSGISSGTASASFSTGVLIVNAASNTPANIRGASILIGNTGVSGSHYVTLSPVSSLAANYSLVLPQIPAQTNVMTLDTSGNMSSTTWNQVGVNMSVVGADAIAATMDATGANAVAASRTRATGSSTEGAGGVPKSASSGTFITSSTSLVNVTNLSVTLTTSGRPIFVGLIPDGTTSDASLSISCNNGAVDIYSSTARVGILNGVTRISTETLRMLIASPGSVSSINMPVSSVQFIDIQSAGTYTYQVQLSIDAADTSGTAAAIVNAKLIAYEL